MELISFLHFPGARYHSAKRERRIRACHRGDKFVCTKDSYICIAIILLDKMVLLKNIQTLYSIAKGVFISGIWPTTHSFLYLIISDHPLPLYDWLITQKAKVILPQCFINFIKIIWHTWLSVGGNTPWKWHILTFWDAFYH